MGWNIRSGFVVALAYVAAATGAAPASAATVTHYYVSAPYVVSNFPGPDRPLMTVGSLTLDPSKLPPGQKLADWTVRGVATGRDGDDFYDWSPEVVAIDFPNAPRQDVEFPDFEIRFGPDGGITRWHLREAVFTDPDSLYSAGGDLGTGAGFDWVSGFWMSLPPGGDFDPAIQGVLEPLGYRPGTPAYQRLADDFFLWFAYTYSDQPGAWFDDLGAFARQIEANTRHALANPPRSIYTIAPIPLPTPLALLIGGLAALVLIGRKRQARRPQRS